MVTIDCYFSNQQRSIIAFYNPFAILRSTLGVLNGTRQYFSILEDPDLKVLTF